MDLSSKENLKDLLKKYQAWPKKRLGQNFLIDKGVIQKIVHAADIEAGETVLEIGPGNGVLTQELAKRAKRVIGIEKDQKMCEILKEVLKEFDNIEIIQGNILKFEPNNLKPNTLKPKAYKIVANLPFYLTAPVIRKFLEEKNPPKEMVLVVQKEVAQRICAKPPKMNLLAVSVQIYAEPEIVDYISKKSFWPQPKVDSAILKITPRQFRVKFSRQFRERFFRIVRAGFSHPRKQILNNFYNELKLDKEQLRSWLLQNNIQPTQRAETLTIRDWLNLTKTAIIL